ncbi:MAG: hypothetical protein JSS09_07215 [Verrucomicrobia bacterium]|nr:hypothetical protein [Verrucomicrobiota bacterium]
MCIPLQINKHNEKSVFTLAFHEDVQTFEQATQKLKGKMPGTFLTFSANGQNFCSAVDQNGEAFHNPFRWDVSGSWYNYSPTAYATEEALLDHLVSGQTPIPLYN